MIFASCLLRSVHVKVISQNGSTTQHQQDVNSSFMVDVKIIHAQIDLTVERAVRIPVYVVSFVTLECKLLLIENIVCNRLVYTSARNWTL